jgi:hypothetical protein
MLWCLAALGTIMARKADLAATSPTGIVAGLLGVARSWKSEKEWGAWYSDMLLAR